jgi:hypothetical protein
MVPIGLKKASGYKTKKPLFWVTAVETFRILLPRVKTKFIYLLQPDSEYYSNYSRIGNSC